MDLDFTKGQTFMDALVKDSIVTFRMSCLVEKRCRLCLFLLEESVTLRKLYSGDAEARPLGSAKLLVEIKRRCETNLQYRFRLVHNDRLDF